MSTNTLFHPANTACMQTAANIGNANDSSAKPKPFAVLHYRQEQPNFTSSQSEPPRQQHNQHHPEHKMAPSRRSNAPSASSSFSLLLSPIALPKRQVPNIIINTSSPAPQSPSPSPALSPSQCSTTVDLDFDTEEEEPQSPGLSQLAQHIAKVAQPLLCQLAAAAIEQDAARMQALGDVERQVYLVELNRRTTRAALEKVVLEWARELTENRGVEGEFVQVWVADISEDDENDDDESEDDQDGGSNSFPSSGPHDDLNDADDSDSDHENYITHLRPPPRRGPYRRSITTATRTPSTPLTHFSPNVYADTSIPSHLAYFVQGRYQHLTLPQPPTAFSNFTAASTRNSSSAIPPDAPTITTQIVDQAARFPLRIPNRHSGTVDALDLPPELAETEDWESRYWVCRVNDWHASQLHRRTLQPARHVRHKWNRNEKEWLKAWVERRGAAAAAATAFSTMQGVTAGGDEKTKAKVDEDVDAALTRDWNAYAVTSDGWRKGLRRRDRAMLREARKKLCKADWLQDWR